MKPVYIHSGRLIDPSQNIDRLANLLIADGKVIGLDQPVDDDVIRIDATGRLVVPGLIDLNVQLREPGYEEDETIETGTSAALAGGFTTIACLPNTDPPVDTAASVEFVQLQAARSDHCHVVVIACVSKNREGEQLAEMGSLARTGAVAFSDATAPIYNAELMRRALQYAQMFDRPIMSHPEVRELSRDGIMHEGTVSTVLGLGGMPAEAEDVMVGRDLRLAEATGGRIHLMNISTAGSVELIRRAKSRGVAVTCDVTAAHLAATDEMLRSFDSDCKLNPPLRSREHVAACIEGLIDGTIDAISSGHAPCAAEKKMCELDQAPFGMSALETVIGLVTISLIEPGHLTWPMAVAKLSRAPARILGLERKGNLAPGADGDVTIIDPQREWVVNPHEFLSKSSNTPFDGHTLRGRAVGTVVTGVPKACQVMMA